MAKQIHILQIDPRTAEILAGTFLAKDEYHQNILISARILLDDGRGHYIYGGQFLSGNTYWWYNRKKCYTVEKSTGKIHEQLP